nr:2112_t:CDS:2 [Entrophospora candida]
MAPYPNHSITKPEIDIGLRLDDNYADTLLTRIKSLLHTTSCFPGTQPIYFKKCHFDLLESEEYYVRDKTDGKRYIMFFTAVDGGTAFMMDELNKFRKLTGFKLPLCNNLNQFHNETMMDGEVVMEIDDEKHN